MPLMIQMLTRHIKMQKIADNSAIGSAVLASAAWLSDVEPVLTALAAVVAIIAGTFAAWYHLEKARMLRRHRLESYKDK